MTQYLIGASASSIKLRHLVESYMKAGWILQGGVAYDTNRKEFLQAMAKGE